MVWKHNSRRRCGDPDSRPAPQTTQFNGPGPRRGVFVQPFRSTRSHVKQETPGTPAWRSKASARTRRQDRYPHVQRHEHMSFFGGGHLGEMDHRRRGGGGALPRWRARTSPPASQRQEQQQQQEAQQQKNSRTSRTAAAACQPGGLRLHRPLVLAGAIRRAAGRGAEQGQGECLGSGAP